MRPVAFYFKKARNSGKSISRQISLKGEKRIKCFIYDNQTYRNIVASERMARCNLQSVIPSNLATATL